MIKPFTTTWKRTKPKPQCQICYKIGYTVAQCFYRFDQEFQALTYTTNNQSMTAMLATPKVVGDPYRFPDSGATNHCTPTIGNLTKKIYP